MNRICFINGSPRGDKSASKGLIDKIAEMLPNQAKNIYEICTIRSLKKDDMTEDFTDMRNANCLVFVFPLYIDAIPSNLLEFMYKFHEFIDNHSKESGYVPPKVYAVINNGFIEGSQNVNALKIIEHYSNRIGFNWRFGLGIGAGEFVRETMEVIPLQSKLKRNIYDALIKLTNELSNQEVKEQSNIMTNPSMPKFLFMAAANRHWTSESKTTRKNLSKKVWTEAK